MKHAQDEHEGIFARILLATCATNSMKQSQASSLLRAAPAQWNRTWFVEMLQMRTCICTQSMKTSSRILLHTPPSTHVEWFENEKKEIRK
jgi:hypothetical protein